MGEGCTKRYHPITITLMVFQFIVLPIAIVAFAIAWTFENSALADRYTTWGSSDPDGLKFIMRLLRNMAIAGSVPAIIVYFIGIMGAFFKNTAALILFIVGCVFCMIIAAVCCAVPSIFAGFLGPICDVIEAECSECNPDTQDCTVYDCWYNKDDFHAICVDFRAKITYIVIAFVAIVVLSLASSIIGCVSISFEKKRKSDKKVDVISTTVVQTSSYPTSSYPPTATVQTSQPYGQPMMMQPMQTYPSNAYPNNNGVMMQPMMNAPPYDVATGTPQQQTV